MDKKPEDKQEIKTPPIVAEEVSAVQEESSYGVISISHSVVSRIVKLATLDVPGVVSIAQGGFELSGIFTKKESTGGINVQDDENGEYHITIHVILSFGIELAKAADQIQQVVRDQVFKMTNKNVNRVDVFIDDVKMPEDENNTEDSIVGE